MAVAKAKTPIEQSVKTFIGWFLPSPNSYGNYQLARRDASQKQTEAQWKALSRVDESSRSRQSLRELSRLWPQGNAIHGEAIGRFRFRECLTNPPPLAKCA